MKSKFLLIVCVSLIQRRCIIRTISLNNLRGWRARPIPERMASAALFPEDPVAAALIFMRRNFGKTEESDQTAKASAKAQ
jgi:hypothetical protein